MPPAPPEYRPPSPTGWTPGPAAVAGSGGALAAELPAPAAGVVGAEISRFAAKVADLAPQMSCSGCAATTARSSRRKPASSSRTGCRRIWPTPSPPGSTYYSLLDVIDIADVTDREPAAVADTYFALMDYLGTDGLLTAVSGLPRDDRWHALARLAVRDDIYGSLRALCFDVLAVGEPGETGPQKIAEWEHSNASRVQRARRTLAEIYGGDARDLATLSVAARQIRT